MASRLLPSLPLAGLLVLGIAPQLRGEMPQASHTSASQMRPAMRSSDSVPEARPAASAGRSSLPPAPAGRPPLPHASYTRLQPTAGIAQMPPLRRCTVLPDNAYWMNRNYDLMFSILGRAKVGYIPVMPFPLDKDTATGSSMVGTGWCAYGFVVPPGGQVQLTLAHEKPAWFRIHWVDQWGEYRPGMKIRIGEPEAYYTNLGKTVTTVYAIVDDPGQWATAADPFTLTAKRSFDAVHLDTLGVTIRQGIWSTAL